MHRSTLAGSTKSKSISRSFKERSSRPTTSHLYRNSNSACLPFSSITSGRHRPSTGPSPATISMLFWPRSPPNSWLLQPDGIRHRNSEREYLERIPPEESGSDLFRSDGPDAVGGAGEVESPQALCRAARLKGAPLGPGKRSRDWPHTRVPNSTPFPTDKHVQGRYGSTINWSSTCARNQFQP